MKAFHLAPHVSLDYWRTVPRLVQVDSSAKAEFARLTVNRIGDCSGASARFDLPAQAAALAVTIAAINAAYALGHRDRANRSRVVMDDPRLPTDRAPLAPVMRGHDDRD